MPSPPGRAWGALDRSLFHGRERELERLGLLARDLSRGWGRSLLLWGLPGTGKTELLKQFHISLFTGEAGILPVYCALPGLGLGLEEFAADFAVAFASQYLAYRRRDPSLLEGTTPPEEVARELAADGQGTGRLLAEFLRRCLDPSRGRARLREAALLPARFAEATGVRVLILLDDFHHLSGYSPGELARWPREGLLCRGAPLILAGPGPSAAKELVEGGDDCGALEGIELAPLSREGAGAMVRGLLRVAGVELSGDLVGRAVELGGRRPFALEALVQEMKRSARLDEAALHRTYASSVCRGGIHRYWQGLLEARFPEFKKRRAALETLVFCLREGESPPPADRLAAAMMKPEGEVRDTLAGLSKAGFLTVECCRPKVVPDPTFRDFLLALYRREAEGVTGSFVEASLAARRMGGGDEERRAAIRERSRARIGVLLGAWKGQKVPRSLFSAEEFSKRYGGKGDEEVVAALGGEGSSMTLPEVVSVASGPLGGEGSASPLEADAFAWAFHRRGEARGKGVCWLVDIVEAAEAAEGDVEAFERKASPVLAAAGAEDLGAAKWLIAPAFSPEAQRLCSLYRILTSTGRQVALLGRLLGSETGDLFDLPAPAVGEKKLEFEMTIPMVSETELVAARAVEQLAENMNFEPEEIGRIKMALVEACINAFEHSGLEEGKVSLRFTVEGGGLEIRVENRGRKFAPQRMPRASGGKLKKRGWGLNLIRELMDEVEFEPVEEGVSLVMVKHLKGKEE